MPTAAADLSTTLGQLQLLLEGEATSPSNRAVAAELIRSLEEHQARVDRTDYRVALIGPIHAGKSAIVNALAGLFLGARPTDRAALKDRAVLTVGAGRTTMCEVRVRAATAQDHGRYGLLIEPMSAGDVKHTFEQVAMEIWDRHHPSPAGPGESLPDPSAEETRSVVLQMTGYAETTHVWFEGNLKRQRRVSPIDEEVPRHGSAMSLAQHLLARARHDTRRREAWWVAEGPSALDSLKTLFGNINSGKEDEAPLPQQVTLVVPSPLPGSVHSADLTLIDTRGLDGAIETRTDLFDLTRDPRTLILLCSSFGDAPSASVREVLSAMARDASLRAARERVVLVLVDKGDADQVGGADGDRQVGQALRVDQCWRVLVGAGLNDGLDPARIHAIDALRDPIESTVALIDAQLAVLHTEELRLLDSLRVDAEGFIGAVEDLTEALREAMDERLREAIRSQPLVGSPMADPLSGLLRALADCRYGWRIRAALSWRGAFPNLHLFRSVEGEARASATRWLDPLGIAVERRLDELERDPTMARAGPLLHERRRQLREAVLRVIDDFGRSVREDVERAALTASVWKAAEAEWGSGRGFRERVIEHFDRWGKLQSFHAHLTTTAARHIPLLAEVSHPPEAPEFTLIVKNLRALDELRWSLQGVNLLIGANGSGKSTALAALRLLNLAYEKGFAQAVSLSLGGASNLRSWTAAEADPVVITLEQGETRWELALRPRDGASAVDSEERLLHRGQEIYAVDTLGRMNYRGGVRDGLGSMTGLRALVTQGATDAPLNRMATLVQRLHVFRVPDVHALKERGSNAQNDQSLESRGGNALSVLRRWQQDPAQRSRYDFVRDGLSLAFPGLVADLGFGQAGNVLVANIFHPGVERPNNLADEADGVVQLLINLCAIASADRGGVVALDQPEDHLHPYALRAFLRHTERLARSHKLTVILATHSTVLLNAMKGTPEQVFVMLRHPVTGTVPNALTELYDENWLQRFELGDLYANDELGSNVDGA